MIGVNRRRVGSKSEIDWSNTYFTFQALDSGWFKNANRAMEYSLDKGKTWTTLAANTNSPTVSKGKYIMWRCTLNPGDKAGRFQSQSQYNVMGNIMSVVFGDDFIGKDDLTGYNNVFDNLFRDANINSAENLCMSATTLANSCCNYMFGFSKIVKAPNILPATTLANNCYYCMFRGCGSLTTTPALPATTLVESCYESMFWVCRSLKTAPELPATEMVRQCYGWMFYGCTNLTSAPTLPATTLAYSCYCGMFANCTSLVITPELPATELANECYRGMFAGCSSLTTAPELPVTALARLCYYYMFAGCTSLTTAPELPATTLVGKCYEYMFYGCTNLNYIKALFTTTPSTTYTTNWVDGVSSTGTFVKNSAATWDVSGVNGIPDGWTVQTASE